jgi:large subunit ribosomal protein L15
MRLNSIRPARGSKTPRLRVGRGIGSGLGKTAGRGHKGQTSRSGYAQKVGFEGGQMPLQRRLPKRGFVSQQRGSSAQVRLHELAKLDAEVIDLSALIKAKVIPSNCKRAKVILSGKLEKAVVLKGVAVTRGAAAAIAQAGGKVES